jgi:hypothetical protein
MVFQCFLDDNIKYLDFNGMTLKYCNSTDGTLLVEIRICIKKEFIISIKTLHAYRIKHQKYKDKIPLTNIS